MKNKLLILLSFLFIMQNTFAQSIDTKTIKKLQDSYKPSSKDIALRNAITNNAINDLAVNVEANKKEDHFFKYEVKSGHVTDQKKSGRCWMFTSLNVFRPAVIKKYNLSDFEFSESYLYFWDILEKSNIFLERIIATASEDVYSREVHTLLNAPINDGGAWNTFTNIVKKYGVVPKEIMPETKQSSNSSKMGDLISKRLRGGALNLRDLISKNSSKQAIQNMKLDILKDVYRILSLSLGEPPAEFKWRYKDADNKISEYKKYTPMSFWKEINPSNNLDDYIMFIDDPTREYYKLYYKKNDKNVYEGVDWTYVNVPVKDLKKFALAAIKDNNILYFSCDVGKQLSKHDGTLDLNNFDYGDLFGVDFKMSRAQRMQTHQSGSSHGMALCGVDTDAKGNPTKWKLENSWGAAFGNNGYLTMTDDWFTEYFFRLVIPKKYLSQKVINVLKEKPIAVPYFNPAFSADK